MEFRVLGPLQVVDDSGTVIRFSDGRQQILLALLLVSLRQTMPMDYLLDAVWDERPPGDHGRATRRRPGSADRISPDARC